MHQALLLIARTIAIAHDRWRLDVCCRRTLSGKIALLEGKVARLSSITCLLLFEGRMYRFLHKSVQEFHAASFVRGQRSTAFAERFYARMLERQPKWDSELAFLRLLGAYHFLKFYGIPDLRAGLAMEPDTSTQTWRPSKALEIRELERVWITLLPSPANELHSIQIHNHTEGAWSLKVHTARYDLIRDIIRQDWEPVSTALEEEDSTLSRKSPRVPLGSRTGRRVTLGEVHRAGLMEKQLKAIARSVLQAMASELREGEQEVRTEEARVALADLAFE